MLDLGCGTGWTSCFFARHGYEVVGYDIAADAIRRGRAYAKRHGIGNVSFASGDYESLPYAEEFRTGVYTTGKAGELEDIYKTLYESMLIEGADAEEAFAAYDDAAKNILKG